MARPVRAREGCFLPHPVDAGVEQEDGEGGDQGGVGAELGGVGEVAPGAQRGVGEAGQQRQDEGEADQAELCELFEVEVVGVAQEFVVGAAGAAPPELERAGADAVQVLGR